MDHLDAETLSAYIDSELPPADMEAIGRHLATCGACRREAQELLGVATLVRELPIYLPRWHVEIEPDERDRDAGPVPMLVEFAKPVALAAVIILVALVGLRFVTDTGDAPDDGEQISFSESRDQAEGTEPAGETSEGVTAGAPEMAAAPPDTDEEAAESIVQEPVAATEPAPAAQPAQDGGGNEIGLVEGLTVAVVIAVALAAAWRVLHRDPSRETRA